LSSFWNIVNIVDIDNNKEDEIDKLLELRDKVLIKKDTNFVIYTALNHLNPKRWGSNTLALTYDLFILLND
jgi:hypothetical protein